MLDWHKSVVSRHKREANSTVSTPTFLVISFTLTIGGYGNKEISGVGIGGRRVLLHFCVSDNR